MPPLPFSTLPAAAKVSPRPFKVAIAEEKLNDTRQLIKLAKFAPQTYENTQSDMRYGVTASWLDTMVRQWTTSYDWRATEDRINSFPQWIAEVEDLQIHFVALFSKKPDAIPILLIHGWPGSFLEFLPILEMFRQEYTPDELPYHLIVPSLPGYTFSSGPPLDRNFTTTDIARVLDQLMKDLGFESGYVAQGGDIGSRVARCLAVDHESCKAVHLNVCFMARPNGISDDRLKASEMVGIKRMEDFRMMGSGYAIEHGTRPSTIGLVLASNPVALLAWVGEKWMEWVDDPLPSAHILDSITLYWLTETFPRSIYTYRQNYPPPPIPATNDPRWYIHKPFGFSYFPKELAPLPRSWIETTGNLVFWNEHNKGGHFAALEMPAYLKNDLISFVDQVWPTNSSAH